MAYLTIQVQLPRDAECPLCREKLIPDSVYFFSNFAVCFNCLNITPDALMESIRSCANDVESLAHWSTAHGLSFFTPKNTAPKRAAAHLLNETHDHPRAHDMD